MNLTRKEFLYGIAVATVGSLLSGCKTSDEKKDDRTNEYFTSTGEVRYFEPGEHAISICETADEHLEYTYTRYNQVEVPEGYVLVGVSSSSNKTSSAGVRYFTNNVPVEAEIYEDIDGNLVCPFPGTPIELELESDNILIKK